MQLAGVIYLFETSQPPQADRRDREIFRKLCGDDALSSVVIGATKSESLCHGAGDSEQHLRDRFWEGRSNDGPAIHRCQNKDESWKMINQVAQGGITPTVLQIQRDLVDSRKPIFDTEVGKLIIPSSVKRKRDLMFLIRHILMFRFFATDVS
jgi:hypothetical protein